MNIQRMSRVALKTTAILLLLFLACSSEVTAQTTWFKYEGNPAMDVGPPGSWDAGAVQGPRVIRVRDTLKMWYEGLSPANFGRIGYAWSTDGGFTWKKYHTNPVMAPTQDWERDWCFSPYVIFTGSRYEMWYSGADGFGQIGYAISRDGIRWTKHARNPVLRSGPSRWDAPRIEWPCVVGPDSSGGFRMWYDGWSEGFKSAQIGSATATNETTWTKLDQLNPVLTRTAGSWDASFLRFARVIFNGHIYGMWYSGGNQFLENHHIGYATSLDGTTWNKFDAPVLQPGRPDPWDAKAVSMPEILFDGTFYHMWYAGYDGAKERIGYAVSPKGTNVEIFPSHKYLRPGRDTVHIIVAVDDRDVATKAGKRLAFSASIKAAQPHYQNPLEVTGLDVFNHVATLNLFDDGAHGDGLSDDGVFANQWVPEQEQLYVVDLKMKPDKESKKQFKIDQAGVFTTIGPITLERVQFVGDSTANPGDTVLVKLTLRNHGLSTAAPSVQASLSTDDASIITITETSPYYWDIPAGKTSTTEGYYRILINPYFSSEEAVRINVTISCWEIPLWHDAFALHIVPPWWRRNWAYAGYLVLAVAMLLGAYRYNLNRIRAHNKLKMRAFEAEKLREVDQMKSRFFANISHEFRTPLTLIEGPARDILAGGASIDAKESAGLIVRHAGRLLALVNQLLDLSKIESGQMKLRAKELDIVEIVRGIAASFESLARRKDIRFNLEFPEVPIVGWFDRDAVQKIVTNLLSNAFKFTSEGGEVTVRVGIELSRPLSLSPPLPISKPGDGERGGAGEGVRISVADTGIGIPANLLAKVFDRFFQVDHSQTREQARLPDGQEGTGIGLSLTKELVELHSGKIRVTSDPGRWTTFVVTLPLGKDHLKPDEILDEVRPASGPRTAEVLEEPRVTALPDSSTGGDKPVLLIVEDNADMRKYMRTHLDDKFKVDEAMDGEEGLRQAIETMPDLIVSDVMMPGMDGFEVCRRLKTDERTSHIPVILLTAKAGMDEKIAGLETGADDYITKPFHAKELEVRAKNLTDQRRMLRERFGRAGSIRLKEIAVTSTDERFLQRAVDVVESHISDPDFTAEEFANEMFLSRMQLHRKMHALTDLSPWQFVRKVRLHRAADLLRKRAGNVSDIAYQIGYDSPSRFSEAFREEFGQSPSQFESTLNR